MVLLHPLILLTLSRLALSGSLTDPPTIITEPPTPSSSLSSATLIPAHQALLVPIPLDDLPPTPDRRDTSLHSLLKRSCGIADVGCGDNLCCPTAHTCITRNGGTFCQPPAQDAIPNASDESLESASPATESGFFGDSTETVTAEGSSETDITSAGGTSLNNTNTVGGGNQDSSSRDSSLSGGAIAGIVIGVVAGVILVGLAILLLLKRRKTRKNQAPPAAAGAGMSEMYGGPNVNATGGRTELGAGRDGERIVEVDGGRRAEWRAEADAGKDGEKRAEMPG